jgi:inward rectifier potassium channel
LARPPTYTVARTGLARLDLRDPYHLAVRISWPRFMALFLALNLALNLVFAALYLLRPGSIANARPGPLADATARLTALLREETSEGQSFRHTHDLRLRTTRLPVFALTWTVMHPIDEHSPLRGIDPDWIAARNLVLFLNFEARDPSLAASVHDTRQYGGADILCNRRYADAVTTDAEGRTFADLGRISTLEPA